MDQTPIEVPGSRWEWLIADRRRMAVAVIAAVALLGAAAALVVAALPDAVPPEADRPGAVEPVPPPRDGAEGGGGTGRLEAPGAPGNGGGSREDTRSAGAPGDAPRPVAPGRAPYIAYRYDGRIWVAREDGTEAVMVAESPQGTFALAPDGTALALVDEGILSFITVANRAVTEVGEAEPDTLAWTADSAAALFVRAVRDQYGVTDVYRVSRRAGDIPIRVVRAAAPAVARDGTVAAVPIPAVETDSGANAVWVLPFGRDARQFPARGLVTGVDVETGTIAYAIAGIAHLDPAEPDATPEPEIWAVRVDGGAERRIVGRSETSRPFGFADLMLSPDGAHLLYAEVGDDGHSRAAVIALAGGDPVPLSVRRDTYPAGWSADGTRVFFIEGNAFQGEPTALVSAGTDGLSRRIVVSGAGL